MKLIEKRSTVQRWRVPQQICILQKHRDCSLDRSRRHRNQQVENWMLQLQLVPEDTDHPDIRVHSP